MVYWSPMVVIRLCEIKIVVCFSIISALKIFMHSFVISALIFAAMERVIYNVDYLLVG